MNKISAVRLVLSILALSPIVLSSKGTTLSAQSATPRKTVEHLSDVHTIGVGSFGESQAANLVREKFINKLAKSSEVTVVEDPNQVDAVVNGLVGVNPYTGSPVTAAFRLMDGRGHILWSDDPNVAGFGSLTSRMADRAADSLIKAIKKNRGN